MDIDVELRKLVEYMDPNAAPPIPLSEAIKQMVRFCEKLHIAIDHVAPEKRKNFEAKLGEIAQKVIKTIHPFIERTGFNEDDLFNLIEKKEEFEEEAWRMVQMGKQQIIDSAKMIIMTLITQQPKESKEKNLKTDKKKPHSPPRSSWMKS